MLICWFYRRILSGCLDANHELPARLSNHLQRCPSCRGFHDAAVGLSEKLLAEASGENEVSSPFLHGRIVASLRNDHPQTGGMILRPTWSPAAAALALVLAGVLCWDFRPGPEDQVGSTPSAPQRASQTAGFLGATVQLPMQDELREWTKKLNQPLETELQSVIQDARTALDLLAHNFLPDRTPQLR